VDGVRVQVQAAGGGAEVEVGRGVREQGLLVMEPSVIPGLVELASFRDPEGKYLGLTKDLSSAR
jgi:predicted enzyme related to lactoylglutathione lyase